MTTIEKAIAEIEAKHDRCVDQHSDWPTYREGLQFAIAVLRRLAAEPDELTRLRGELERLAESWSRGDAGLLSCCAEELRAVLSASLAPEPPVSTPAEAALVGPYAVKAVHSASGFASVVVDNNGSKLNDAEVLELLNNHKQLQRLNENLAERVAKQSELLSKRAEKKPTADTVSTPVPSPWTKPPGCADSSWRAGTSTGPVR